MYTKKKSRCPRLSGKSSVLYGLMCLFTTLACVFQLLVGFHFLPRLLLSGESVANGSEDGDLNAMHDQHQKEPNQHDVINHVSNEQDRSKIANIIENNVTNVKNDHLQPTMKTIQRRDPGISDSAVLLRDLPEYQFNVDDNLDGRKQGLKWHQMETLPLSEIDYWNRMIQETIPKWKNIRHWDQQQRLVSFANELKAHPKKYKMMQESQPSSHGNPHCQFKGKVVNIGLMKTGTSSMVAALHSLGYRCGGDSCIHIGHWMHLKDAEILHYPLPDIIDAILSIPEYYRMYRTTFTMAATFGDSPWNFLFPVFDEWFNLEIQDLNQTNQVYHKYLKLLSSKNNHNVMDHNSDHPRRQRTKYILMVRSSNEEYVNSYVSYIKGHSKSYVTHGLTMDEFAYLVLRRYEIFNSFVIHYFKSLNRLDDLLILDLKQLKKLPNQWQPLTEFLECEPGWIPRVSFPHQNKSKRRSHGLGTDRLSPNFDYDWKSYFRNMVPKVDHDPSDDHKDLKRLRIWLEPRSTEKNT